ncbi:MAG: cation transporter [Deltaproteobacteria bacterium]|nr:cation transporter [Deltaproteobacteria bacterium]
MYKSLIRQAVFLAWFTILYNLVEGTVSIAFGAGEDSVSLFGFGIDSLIEVASAFLVLLRLRGESEQSIRLSVDRERRISLTMGILFLLLALVTITGSSFQLFQKGHPSTTLPGMIISLLSLSFMFALWISKRKLARLLNSAALLNDSQCSLACIKLSLVLLIGSLLFWIFPALWWADSIAAIVIAALIACEGMNMIRSARSPEFSGGCGCC